MLLHSTHKHDHCVSNQRADRRGDQHQLPRWDIAAPRSREWAGQSAGDCKDNHRRQTSKCEHQLE